MKTNLSNLDGDIELESETPQTSGAVVPAASSEVVGDDFFHQDESETPDEFKRTPRVELVHPVGFGPELGFAGGSVTYNREDIIYSPKVGKAEASKPFKVVVLGYSVKYTEKLSDKQFKERKDAGVKQEWFTTKAEARAAGLVTATEKRKDPASECGVFQPVMTIQGLFGGNELCSELPVEIDGEGYVMAEAILKGGSYWGLGVKIGEQANLCKAYGTKLSAKTFIVEPKFESFGAGDPAWALKCLGTKKLSAEGIAAVEALLARLAGK